VVAGGAGTSGFNESRTVHQLRALLGLSQLLQRFTEEQELLDFIAKTVCEQIGFGLCTIALLEGDEIFRVRVLHDGATTHRSSELSNYEIPKPYFDRIEQASQKLGNVLWLDGRSPLAQEFVELGYIIPTSPSIRSSEWHPASVLFSLLRSPDGSVIGLLCPDDPLDGKLPSTESAILLETFAHLGSAALELLRARSNSAAQLRILEAQRQQIARLFAASTALKRESQLDDMLATVVETMAVAGGFRRVALYLSDDGAATLRVRSTYGLTNEEDRRLRDTPVPFSIFAPLMQPAMRISRSYLYDHRRFQIPDELVATMSIPVQGEASADGEWHALDSLNIPLLGHQEELLGVISIDEPESGAFPDLSHIEALEFFADQCAEAVIQVQQYRRLTLIAETDSLTGLPNRRALTATLRATMRDCRDRRSALSALFIDLDHFKTINDSYGHLQGDQVLIEIVRLLRTCLRRSDYLARFGGEEFVVLLPDTDEFAASEVAETLRSGIEKATLKLLDDVSLSMTASIGVATIDLATTALRGSTPRFAETLLRMADEAMYRAKHAGRNAVSTAE
jgi:diguanylate cyclase (GGDEF)-like protein